MMKHLITRSTMYGERSWRLVVLFLTVIFVTALVAPDAWAHGGGTEQLINEDIGPYWISVWTSPNAAREGMLHVTVAVAEPGRPGERQAGVPILGATVQVTLTPQAPDVAPITAAATNEQSANKIYYEADMNVPAAGLWVVQIDVNGPDGSGQAQFELPVQPGLNSGWLLPGGISFVLIAAFFYYYATRRRSRG